MSDSPHTDGETDEQIGKYHDSVDDDVIEQRELEKEVFGRTLHRPYRGEDLQEELIAEGDADAAKRYLGDESGEDGGGESLAEAVAKAYSNEKSGSADSEELRELTAAVKANTEVLKQIRDGEEKVKMHEVFGATPL